MYDLHLKAGLGSLEETAWFSMKEVFNTNFFSAEKEPADEFLPCC